MVKKIVIASHNKGKVREIHRIFSAAIGQVEILTLDDFPEIGEIEETGESFEENALIKAATVFKLTNVPALADDSGLVVDHLGGAPGIYSARYSGEGDLGNIKKVLNQLESVASQDRSARFVAVAAYVDGSGPLVARGELEGEITREPRGENGFGYDPIFRPLNYSQTLAELDPTIKDKISHRGASLSQLAPALALRLGQK
jgi:XTP/dITP diphosphohydrolase